jgi:hypothetical protein
MFMTTTFFTEGPGMENNVLWIASSILVVIRMRKREMGGACSKHGL